MSNQNMARHPHRSIMDPPTSGPRGAPTAPAAVQIAGAAARRPRVTICGISASDMGVNTEAARPIITRATTRTPTAGAAAARTAPTANRAMPPVSRRRWPRRSP